MQRCLILAVFSICLNSSLFAQDSISLSKDTTKPTRALIDTFSKKKHSPKKAAIRSAILPGWGQAYNGKYWKIPIVYTAIGIPVGTFLYNKKWYTKTRDAAKMLGSTPPDTANYRQRVDERLYTFFSTPGALPSLLNYRNEFRKGMDYSVLIALVFWGLNVVDATVDGHLKEFDVSENLSLKIKPSLLSGTTTAGLSLVFTIGPTETKRLNSR